MRITPEILLKLARDTAAKRAKADREILAVYLSGSLVAKGPTEPPDPLIGGTTDIDLFFVYNNDDPESREILRMTDEVHLDIAHHPRSLYRQTRELRTHSWLGPTVNHCKILYDPQHFMDFTQASVRGQFDQPETVLSRARAQAEAARQIWFAFQADPVEPGPSEIAVYLKAVELAANAVASLTGAPLPVRRLMLEFSPRAQAVGTPGLYPGLAGLLGASHTSADQLTAWLPKWGEALRAVDPEHAPVKLHLNRLPYYSRAMEAMLDSEHPQDALSPLLSTWTASVCLIPADSPHRIEWQEALSQLELLGENFQERIEALDAYLDMVEETLEAWGQQRGVS